MAHLRQQWDALVFPGLLQAIRYPQLKRYPRYLQAALIRLEEIRWQIEELRISLFAPQLGSAYLVSVPRIEKRWLELGL